jgi:hypothetical protein
LSNSIELNKKIKGIKIAETEVKQTLFADDGTFITDGSEESFENLIETFDNFANISGLKLNAQKCNIIRTGNLEKNNITYMINRNFNWKNKKAKALGIIFSSSNKDLLKDNLEPKITEFMKCLKSWEHRKLTLLGKITVIKTLALPKLIYPLTVLPSPTESTLNEIKGLCYKFIWNKKPDKIKRKVITQRYDLGGLKMIDIDKYVNSLKAGWIKRLFDETNRGTWKKIYVHQLMNYGGKLIIECNLSSKEIETMFKKQTFLKDILKSWYTIYKHDDTTLIRNEILWNNKRLKSNNSTLYYCNWYNRGIKYVEQLYDFRKKRFFTFDEFMQLFQIPEKEFLKYNKLISCIPREWKNKIKNETLHGNPQQNPWEKIFNAEKVVKHLYNFQLQNEPQIEMKTQQLWENLFDNKNINWKKVYTLSFKCTLDQTLRNFQYKYLMQIVRCNDFLCKHGLVNSNLCDFCNMCTETPMHLFWECHITQTFWSCLTTFINSKVVGFKINKQVISLGILSDKQIDNLFNFIIIYAKYYIYSCKLQKRFPCLIVFKHKLKKIMEIEKQIALNHDNHNTYEAKWLPLIGVI